MGNASLIQKILDYEESIKLIYMLQDKYEPEKIENWNLVQKVFDRQYFNRLDSIKAAARDSSGKSFDINDKELVSFLSRNYPMFSYEKNAWHELKNWAYNSSWDYRIQLRNINAAKRKAQDLIQALKKEYRPG